MNVKHLERHRATTTEVLVTVECRYRCTSKFDFLSPKKFVFVPLEMEFSTPSLHRHTNTTEYIHPESRPIHNREGENERIEEKKKLNYVDSVVLC